MNFPAFVENVLATRLKQIDIAGFRGVRACISIPLNGSSLLLYGDNGSGKSSITDAFEWFYHDRVGHLSTEGIGKKGISALRNIHLPDEKDGQVDLAFSDGALSSTKTLTSRHDKLSSKHSNESEGFVDYLDQSQKENLILRYRDLLEFILHTKAQNLREISHIIGFEEVAKTKSVLKKAVNDLKKEQKMQNCESRASAKQAIIIAQIGQNVVSREQYLEAVRTLVAHLKLALAITDETSIEQVLESIKGSGNDQDVLVQASYEKAAQGLRGLVDAIKDKAPKPEPEKKPARRTRKKAAPEPGTPAGDDGWVDVEDSPPEEPPPPEDPEPEEPTNTDAAPTLADLDEALTGVFKMRVFRMTARKALLYQKAPTKVTADDVASALDALDALAETIEANGMPGTVNALVDMVVTAQSEAKLEGAGP